MNAVFETRFAKVGETIEHYRQRKITSTHEGVGFAEKFLRPYFADKHDQEEFLIVTLDTRYRPIRIIRITRGTLDASMVHPREVFRAALVDCASAIILAHNHPSGDPTPSPQDIAVTARLKQCGELLGIRVIDHFVVGDSVVSLAEHGVF